jgi:hypothetical protein
MDFRLSRTAQKFLRDLSVTVIIAGLGFIAENIGVLNLDPGTTQTLAIGIPAGLAAFRLGRSATGLDWD